MTGRAAGCLVIGGDLSGECELSGLSSYLNARGVAAEAFCCARPRDVHTELQRAYQAARMHAELSIIAAAGAGCDAALALAGQLPVDRLALVTGRAAEGCAVPASLEGPLRRLRSYARRNAALCVAEVMILQAGEESPRMRPRALSAALVNCRIGWVQVAAQTWMNRKDQMNMLIYRFLRDGVLPKSLAENPEMCIIYG